MGKNPRSPASKPYRVGKGRPPIETRWKPGQSGNPKGRPRGSRNIGDVLTDVLKQRVVLTEKGITRKVLVLEAMFRRLVSDALRNQPQAMKFLMTMVDRYANTAKSELRLEELAAQDQRILARYLGSAFDASASRPEQDHE
jgi:hypothetical protein